MLRFALSFDHFFKGRAATKDPPKLFPKWLLRARNRMEMKNDSRGDRECGSDPSWRKLGTPRKVGDETSGRRGQMGRRKVGPFRQKKF